MEIFRFQMKRILRAPFFLGLLAVFLAFDFYLISTNSDHQREINLINDVAGQTGVQINTDFEKKFSAILGDHTRDLGNLYREKIGKTASDPDTMLKELGEKFYTMTDAEQGRFRDDSAILQLDGAVRNRRKNYEGYDLAATGKDYIRRGAIKGFPAEIITRNCAALEERIKEVQADGEADTLFFPGEVYKMHDFLYGTLLRTILIESAILGVLAMMYAVNFEFAHGTQSLAYASRRGRKLTADQFRAAMLAGMLVPVLLTAVVLPAFFAGYHFSNLWNASVDSAMNAEPFGMFVVPYVTWHPMTVWQYLWVTIVSLLALQAVFCFLAFVFAVFFRNSYVGFLLYALVGMLAINLPSFLIRIAALAWVASVNPVIAWYTCRGWLTSHMDPLVLYPQYIPAVCLLGAVIAAAAGICGVRRFRRADL